MREVMEILGDVPFITSSRQGVTSLQNNRRRTTMGQDNHKPIAEKVGEEIQAMVKGSWRSRRFAERKLWRLVGS